MFCPNCGFEIYKEEKFCFKCGKSLQRDKSHEKLNERSRSAGSQPELLYAGFFRRVIASTIDVFLWLLYCITVFLLPIHDAYNIIVGFFIAWLYYALLESSTWQGTIGKKIAGISVCDMEGKRISFWRASSRYFMHILSNITMLIGYIMPVFTEKKQTLHDIVSGCVLVKK